MKGEGELDLDYRVLIGRCKVKRDWDLDGTASLKYADVDLGIAAKHSHSIRKNELNLQVLYRATSLISD